MSTTSHPAAEAAPDHAHGVLRAMQRELITTRGERDAMRADLDRWMRWLGHSVSGAQYEAPALVDEAIRELHRTRRELALARGHHRALVDAILRDANTEVRFSSERIGQLEAEVETLRAEVRCLGERSGTCTYTLLGERCRTCRCGRTA